MCHSDLHSEWDSPLHPAKLFVLALKQVHVNGAPPELTHAYVTQLGDVLTPAPSERPAFRDNLSVAMGSLMYDVHRDHLQL